MAPIIGALLSGKRKGDGLIRFGFAGTVLFVVFRMWAASIDAEREMRREQHQETVTVMRELKAAIAELAEASDRERLAASELRMEIIHSIGSRAPSRSVIIRPIPSPPDAALPAGPK